MMFEMHSLKVDGYSAIAPRGRGIHAVRLALDQILVLQVASSIF
jgi:hypothetical protein